MLPTPNSFNPAALVGTTLDGRYQLVEYLASGGMGAVYRAEHVYMRKQVAVKLLRPELSALPEIAERFRREAQIAASLEHEHIVRVTDFGRSSEGWLFLVMDLLEGESLFERLRDGTPLEPIQAVRILAQICAGLDAAHRRGIVHRDLKPENIFLARDGTAKIVDFGIAKISDAASPSQTQSGMVVGTPEYLSPEQAAGISVDARADLYAVGLIAWRMLAGRHPLQADDARGLLMKQATQPIPPLIEARPELAGWSVLLSTIERACAKDPAARHASASELHADLEASLSPGDAARAARGAPSRPSASAAALVLSPAVTRIASTVELPPAKGLVAILRSPRFALSIAFVAVLAVIGGVATARWLRELPLTQARELLAANRPEAARDLVIGALRRHPSDARLHVLHGRALHRIEGQAAAALDAYAAALEIDPHALDEAVLSEISADLNDPALADRSARVLAGAGATAVPSVIAAARRGSGPVRLRALELTRQLGAEDRIDVVAEYATLLQDPDCAVRRAAVRHLADTGSPDALPSLRELAHHTREVRGLFGFPQRVPVCGAFEADTAARQIAGEPHEARRP